MATSVLVDCDACCGALSRGDFVEVHDLTSDRGRLLNGQRGSVLRHTGASGRFEVCLAGAELASLKPQNLSKLGDEERLESLETCLLEALDTPVVRAQIERLRAESADRAAFHARLHPELAELLGPVYKRHGVDHAWRRRPSSASCGVAPASRRGQRIDELCAFGTLGPSGLERGEQVEVAGLESAGGQALNGLLGRLRSWDAARGRYEVEIAQVGSQAKALLPGNLRRIAERRFATSAEAREFQHALRDAYAAPAAQPGWRELVGSAAGGTALRDAVLAVQRPVLERFGFRGDWAGQHQMREAGVAAFEADAGLGRDATEPLGCHSPGASDPAACCADTVVFLDVDGVLHSLHGEDVFQERCCALLEQILRSTGAAVVLSSTWRMDESQVSMINDMLLHRRLPPIHGRTKDLGSQREAEICEWLDSHPEVLRWIAIDDQDLQSRETDWARRMRGHFVQTNKASGLTLEDAPLAIALLLAQDVDLSASYLGHSFLPHDFEALLSRLRCGAEGGGGTREASDRERLQLWELYSSCRAGLPGICELSMACGVGPELQRALAERRLDSVSVLAGLRASRGGDATFEDRVLGVWFDPGDGGGERALTAAEADALRQLGDACLREVGPTASGGRTLQEVAETCGVAPAVMSALTELLVQHRAACTGKVSAGAGRRP